MSAGTSITAALLVCTLLGGAASASEQSELLYSRGLVLFNAHKYKQAIELFDQAVEAEPGDPYAHHYRGVARARVGDLDGAVADLETALKLKPDLAESALELGVALVEGGRYSDAVPWLERAQANKDVEAPASLFLGLAQLRLGEREPALENFRRAAADPSLVVSSQYYQGVIAYQEARWSEAQEHFTRVVEASPDSKLGHEAAQFLEAVRVRQASLYQVFGRLAFEYDSNLTLTPGGQVIEETISRKSDERVAIAGGGTYVPWRTDTMLLSVGYDFFQSLHFHHTAFNLQQHQPAVRLIGRRDQLGFGFETHYGYYRLQDQSFLQEAFAAPWLTINDTPVGRIELLYRLRYNDFLDSDFNVRDALNQAAAVRNVVEFGTPDRYAIIGYRFDNEDPRKSDPDSERYGYSGNEVSGGVGWRFPGDVVGEAVYAYRYERYLAASADFDPQDRRRRDHEHVITVVAYRQLTDHLRAIGAFFGTVNDSNQSQFQYQRYIGSIGLEALF